MTSASVAPGRAQAMVLAARDQQAAGTERLVLATAAGPIAAGSRVA